jgi:hypothetical protein
MLTMQLKMGAAATHDAKLTRLGVLIHRRFPFDLSATHGCSVEVKAHVMQWMTLPFENNAMYYLT